jgi:hypothetical protein
MKTLLTKSIVRIVIATFTGSIFAQQNKAKPDR